MKRFVKHLPHSIFLGGILFAGFTGLILFSYSSQAQMFIAFLTACSYVLWGVSHHTHVRDFHWELLLEYLAVAFLGFIVIFTLIIRS